MTKQNNLTIEVIRNPDTKTYHCHTHIIINGKLKKIGCSFAESATSSNKELAENLLMIVSAVAQKSINTIYDIKAEAKTFEVIELEWNES